MLLEPAPGPLGDGLGGLVERLAARGARMILAHPERHAGADFEQRLRALVAQGCLIQWTAEFVLGDPGDPDDFVLRLARAKASCICSQATRTPPRRAAAAAGRRASSACATSARPSSCEWIAERRRRAILAGEPLAARAAGERHAARRGVGHGVER